MRHPRATGTWLTALLLSLAAAGAPARAQVSAPQRENGRAEPRLALTVYLDYAVGGTYRGVRQSMRDAGFDRDGPCPPENPCVDLGESFPYSIVTRDLVQGELRWVVRPPFALQLVAGTKERGDTYGRRVAEDVNVLYEVHVYSALASTVPFGSRTSPHPPRLGVGVAAARALWVVTGEPTIRRTITPGAVASLTYPAFGRGHVVGDLRVEGRLFPRTRLTLQGPLERVAASHSRLIVGLGLGLRS